MEVIYTGLHQTPEQIVATVIQEDADAVGLSILSGAHMTLVPRIIELLASREPRTCRARSGARSPRDDIPELKRLGRRRGVHSRRADRRHRRVPAQWRSPPGLGG